MGRLDDAQHVGVGQHDPAGVLAAGQTLEALPERIAIGDAMVQGGGEFERRA